VELKQISEIIIDEISTDTVLSAGYDIKLAEQKVADFRRFIEENKDELTALQILYAQPYVRRHLGWQAVKDLRDAMARPPWLLQPIALWACYRRLNASKVRDASPASVLTDLVALVRYALGHSDTLQPLSADVAGRFNLWIGRERRAGREYSPEQIRWLTMIRDHVAANVEVTLDDLQEVPDFADQGGRIAANRLFGRERLPALLDELSDTLIGTAAAA
jgi:type I restriction enzyme R subunit